MEMLSLHRYRVFPYFKNANHRDNSRFDRDQTFKQLRIGFVGFNY